MERTLEQRVQELEKRVAELEGQVPAQPKEVILAIDGKELTRIMVPKILSSQKNGLTADLIPAAKELTADTIPAAK